MSEPAAELSTRAVVARIARVYMAPRWKGWTVAMIAAIAVAYLSASLIQILEPAINDLLVNHKPGTLLAVPLTIAGLALARGLSQVIQATQVNRIGNEVVGQVQVQGRGAETAVWETGAAYRLHREYLHRKLPGDFAI